MRKIDDIISEVKIWGNKNISYEPLDGGLSNYTYKVTADDVHYVLRVNGGQNDFLNLSKPEEIKAIHQAHEIGIGVKIYTGESNAEYIITEYKNARIVSNERAHDPAYIKKFADILRKAHEITGVNRRCSPFCLIEKYLSGAKELKVKIPDDLDAALEKMVDIEKRSTRNSKYTEKYCHNDFYSINVLNDNGAVYLIDWELSGVGDIFFDLATISFSQVYSDNEDKLLLESYFGYYEDEFAGMMYDMKYMNMLREVAWALLHAGMKIEHVNHSFNYYNSAQYFLGRIKDGFVTM